MGTQRIKCNVCDCKYNDVNDCACKLEEIFVCPGTAKSSKNPLKDTACSSYKYSEVHNKK